MLLAFSLISGGAYFLAAVRPLQQASNARDALQNLQVALIRNSYGWTDVEVPSKDRKSVLMQALPHLMKLEELENGDNGRMLSFSLDDEKDIDPEIFLYLPWARRLSLAGARIEDIESLRTLNRLQILSITETNVTDLGPVASLSKLVDLSIRGTRVVDISPLRQLLSLRHLSLPNTGVSNLEALTAMHQLEVLDLAGTKVSDLRPFKWLYSLKKLAVDMTEVDDLAPLSGLANLETLSASFTKVRNLRPPVALKALIRLDVSDTFTIDVTPLANLSNLQELNLSRTHVNKFGLQPLQALTKLRTLALDGTGVRDFNADGHLVGLNVLQDPPPPRADALYPVKASFRDCAECPQMLVVPSGTFQMGSPKSEEGRFDNEELPKTVTLAHSFAVGRYEVRSDEWMHCVRAGACKWMSHEGWGRGFRPVISTSWDDAQTYVAWLSKKTGKSYRLLTEVEWEYVARAGSNSSRPWQDANGERCRVANVDDHSLRAPFSFFDRCDDGYTNTAPVGTYLPNAFGAHDTIGNVMEWVADCLDTPDRGLNESGRRPAPATKSCEKRVARGGSWFSDSRQSRFAVRAGEPSGTSSPEFGFRVARTLAKR